MRTILSIAGSDSGACAGIQADIKSAQYHNVYACTAITALTAQNSLGVQDVKAICNDFVLKQIDSILSDFTIDAIKIGMLGNKHLIDEIKNVIKDIKDIPIVLDPVAVSRSGDKLLDEASIDSLRELFNYSTLVTPNKHEAKIFFDVDCIEDILSCDNYNTNIIFKNIESSDDFAIDILKAKEGKLEYFQTPKASMENTNGTGCSFSTSIASLLAKGLSLEDSIELSKNYIYGAIKSAPNLGNGNGPINHNLKD